MKYIFIALLSIVSLSAIAQTSDIIDVVIDDKPAKMNIKTGEFTFTGKFKVNQDVTPSAIISQNDTFYTVVKGDTFYSISRRYGVSVAQLKALNVDVSNGLSIGQQLKVKAIQTNAVNETVSNTTVYTVQKGDTLYSVARKHNISVSRLKAINNLETNAISIGQSLNIQ